MTTIKGRTGTAVIVIDVQTAVVEQAHDRDGVVARIAAVVGKARDAQVPVVWVQHSDDELVRDTPGWRIVGELTPAAGEPVVHKSFGDSFEGTDLEGVLDRLGAAQLVVTGAQTDFCVRSTLHGAVARGYDALLVSDAHTTNDAEWDGTEMPAASVIAHTNMYWHWHRAPGRRGAEGRLMTEHRITLLPRQGRDAAPPARVRDGERLTIKVLRYNPADPASVPHLQGYELEQSPGMTLFIALNEIRDRLDPSLQFDFVCRAGICGSCAMVINGRPTLACRTLTRDVGPEIVLAPLPVFELIGDLSVDTGKWMRAQSERLAAWVHLREDEPDLTRLEQRMEPELAERIFELDRCIECGCCVAACGTARMRADFVGAVGINKIARFRLDPRDTRDDAAFYELVGDDDGVFGCMSLLACHDVCPKDLPLQTQIAYVRRKMAAQGFGG